MAVGLPLKTTYVDGEVFSASDINDTNGTVNLVGQTNNFYAGKNRIINGDFTINQRAFTSTTTSGAYGQDRFYNLNSNGTTTYSAQTFTPGTAPVTGYESTNFARIVTTGQTLSSAFSVFGQKIEDVRTFANQTVTFSFWAKAASGTPSISANFFQDFGSGGSSGVYSYPTTQKQAITTSWARYSFTTTIASVAGKTIGTGSFLAAWIWTSAGADFNTQTGSLGIQSATIDIWGVQVEAGSTATAFQTASGSIGGELALCQRYYYRSQTNSTFDTYGAGFGRTSSTVWIQIKNPVTMRAIPNSVDFANLHVSDGGTANPVTALAISSGLRSTTDIAFFTATVSSAAAVNRPFFLINDGSSSAFVGYSAEL